MKNSTSIEQVRHSLAHLLAAAVLEKYPKARLGIGPTVDNGFYYDFQLPKTPSPKDLEEIEAEIRALASQNIPFTTKEITADDARTLFAKQPFKLELIEELSSKNEPISVYETGSIFTDLCRGPHVETTGDIPLDGFKLAKIAGAYWKGDEKREQLTRIYGLSFTTKEELTSYETMLTEAEKRDHRKIGKELDLFTFSDLVGPGLPLWTPRGTMIRELLNDFVWELREARGFEKVAIPHITKRALYETSGHWDKFKDELFKIVTREQHEYAMKPMNCPHHTQIFSHLPRSYRDMPQRYAETTMVYRDEQSGELSGLSRVLCITQDDAHVFCRMSQVKEEMFKIWDIIDTFYSTFGFDLKVRLSFHDPEKMEKYLGNADTWEKAETALRDIARERGTHYFEASGEAAMYGPKIDFMAHDSLGRQLQVATIQLDMNMPERFNLYCVNEKGEHERIVMLHCAIMGSIERFLAALIEHLSGNFPTWLSPTQVRIIPVSEKHVDYARIAQSTLTKGGVRVEIDDSNNTIGKKIREAKIMRIPYLLVVGDKELSAGTVTVESRDRGSLGAVSTATFLADIVKEISSRARYSK